MAVGKHPNDLNQTQLSIVNGLKLKLAKLKEQKLAVDVKFNK
jgi:hypothetical protein